MIDMPFRRTAPLCAAATIAVLTFGPSARAGFNDYAFTGAIAPGEVDFFQVEFGATSPTGNAYYFGSLFFEPTGSGASLGLFNMEGALIQSVGDTGGVIGDVYFLPPGPYMIGVTGLGDELFGGNHAQSFEYLLIVYPWVPGPPAIGLLGIAAMLGRSRRRRV
jgi:hypothetical protein